MLSLKIIYCKKCFKFVLILYKAFVNCYENRINGQYQALIAPNMWCFARFGTICRILKTWKTPMEECHF